MIATKVKHEATKEDLRLVEKALRMLKLGNYKMIRRRYPGDGNSFFGPIG
jgi:hypothetical protein